MKRRNVEILVHIVFWSLALYTLMRTMGVVATENVFIVGGKRTVTRTEAPVSYGTYVVWISSMFLFYTNTALLLPLYLRKRRVVLYLVLLVAAITVTVLIEGIPFAIIPRIFVYCLFLGLSFAYFFVREWRKDEQIKTRLREENLKTELNFLKSQIQPHFLFNVLNNLFQMAQETKHKELTNGISSLSAMIRHMIYDSESETVSLVREVEYLENYIRLHFLKFSSTDKVRFSFDKAGDLDKVRLAPFILLPFVENAFKYGVNLEGESRIEIKLQVIENSITFEVVNTDYSSIHKTNKEKSGIGLENVRRRLDLVYPKRHELTAGKVDELFVVKLQIRFES